MDLNDPLRQKNLERIFDRDVMGVVVNKDQSHWFALKVDEHERIWLLDSLESPEYMIREDFLKCIRRYRDAFLVRHIGMP